MSIPNYLYALANHKGAATINAGGLSIPVKIMDIEHKSSPYEGDECTFKCLVVNPEEIQPERYPNAAAERLAKQALNSFYGANGPEYVRQALAKAAGAQALHEARVKASKPTYVANNPFEIKKVYFNNPVTVVLWADGTKTIVRCQEGDVYSKETGLALCFAKKALGNKGNFNDVFHKWIPEEKHEPKMTFRTKLLKDNPHAVSDRYIGGCAGCPSSYGYEPVKDGCAEDWDEVKCRTCWNREVPNA